MSDQSTIRNQFHRATTIGASAAAMAFALVATPAFADSSAAPDAGDLLGGTGNAVNVQLEAQSGGFRIDGGDAVLEPQTGSLGGATPEPEILIANPGTSVTDRDPVNITGIGQMVINQGGGFVGLCTASLINPRTVIFAAHCVNTSAAGAYGAGTGGTPIAFGFEANTRANAVGQPDELLNWFNGGSTGPGINRTNVAQAFYNSNYVSYNPLSLDPNSCTGPGSCFLIGDIATATLDTPAANIPTWALLFSQLPATTITAAGTGYHVSISGYGNAGTGEGGATSIDFRRRVAENTLGALASLDEFENFLFGGNSTTNPQNVFWIDFDDPRRGTALASPFDFNAWRDNALPNEGLTSGGDSGGPLILDRAYARSVILGVLSGGYTRFFNGQPANGYGTAAFYQPLYLYWDWIAANNPYHYVGSVAGNANWTDPTHWVTNLDPTYQIIVNGALVNGVPTNPGTGNTDTPGFGQACFQSGGVSDCYDVATGVETVRVAPIGTAGNDAGSAQIAVNGEAATTGDAELASSGTGRPSAGALEAQAGGTTAALPLATLANGLPGATNFVPNNFDGNRLTQTAPRYFDVTLGAVGTTTLNSTVVIDRFTLANTGAGLDIQTTGSLTSLIGVTQMVGTMQVNGTLRSGGDYMMLAGGLNGTGTIFAPFFTSIAGTISPGSTGAAGTIGTLTFRGNTIFASGTTYMVDLGSASASDKIDVIGLTAADGIANVGGRLVFNVVAGSQPRAGDFFKILTATNAVTGTFATPTAISAILTPIVTYTPREVLIQLKAGAYYSIIDRNSAVQYSYAALLDGNRGTNYGPLADIYGPLDLQNAGTIQAFFENAAPRNETLRTALGVVASGTTDRFFRSRIHGLEPGDATGELAVSGNPLTLAAQGSFSRAVAPLTAGLGFDEASRPGGHLPDDMSGYLVGGYLNGSSAPMPAAASSGRDTFDGWFLAGGIEKAMGEQATFGFALSYADIDGTTGGVAQQASTRLFQGTVYVAARTDAGLRGDLRISAGALSTDSSRTVTLLTTPQALMLKDTSLVFSSELGLGFDLIKDGTFSVVPRISARYESIGFDKARETGGSLALTVERYGYEALEGRAGMSFAAKPGSRVRPFLEANYVHEFLDQPTFFTGSFIGGVAHAPFALAGTDNDWGEISGGIAFGLGSRAEISLEADTTVFRDDFRNQSYRGRITIHF